MDKSEARAGNYVSLLCFPPRRWGVSPVETVTKASGRGVWIQIKADLQTGTASEVARHDEERDDLRGQAQRAGDDEAGRGKDARLRHGAAGSRGRDPLLRGEVRTTSESGMGRAGPICQGCEASNGESGKEISLRRRGAIDAAELQKQVEQADGTEHADQARALVEWPSAGGPSWGSRAPDWSTTDMEGNRNSLKGLRGKIVIMDSGIDNGFGACVRCRR